MLLQNCYCTKIIYFLVVPFTIIWEQRECYKSHIAISKSYIRFWTKSSKSS